MSTNLNEMDKLTEGGHYALINGLNMYYEVAGSGQPLIMIHGALSATGTSFGQILPGLAQTRQVISVEMQAHGHTSDLDRPLSYEQMADDTAALVRYLGITSADLLGYSMGGGVAFQVASRHPELVRKLVLISTSYNREGVYSEVMDGMDEVTPEMLAGTPFAEEYARIAPDPAHWPETIKKSTKLDHDFIGWPAEDVKKITTPTLLMSGDADIIRPEHTIEFLRLLGGGVIGDFVGLPKSRMAIIPGATHITIMSKASLLLAIIPAFLDEAVAEK